MYTTILYATDLSEDHYDLCQKAAEIALRLNATLHLLHVIETPPSLQLAQGLGFAEFDQPLPMKEDAKAVMKFLGEALNIPEEQQHVEIGSIKMKILETVQNLGCDLIIIGSHSPNALPAFLGSAAHAVVHRASCDVLTLRNKLE